jgi:MFS family permease
MAEAQAVAGAGGKARASAGHPVLVIGASSAGTVFEWYDFFLYGSLAGVITKQFFSGVDETTGYIFALLAFAAGFAVRPLGALVFGRIGDRWGRKNTFLVTMLLMGLSTFTVGLLPSYASVGVAAPMLLIGLRLVQGLAMGGEYGGAATYVAEHAPPRSRGLYTSFIQTTGTCGLLLSLVVILAVRTRLGEGVFADWGWRVPFLVSSLLLIVSLWIRLQLNESPLFRQMAEEGRGTKAPLAEAFGRWSNIRLSLLALFGLVAGQAVIWYTGQFYALTFLVRVIKLDEPLANSLVAVALVIGAPLFIIAGWLSDRIGRKPVIMFGVLLAVFAYFPAFELLTAAANPALAAAAAKSPVTVAADPADCSFQFDPVGKAVFNRSCDIAKSFLAKAGVSYANAAAPTGAAAVVRIGQVALPSFHGEGLPKKAFEARRSAWEKQASAALAKAGYPAKADPAKVDRARVIGILVLLNALAALTYGPLAAMLVEMFPIRIRYTALSLPYHIGNGWFGGFLPPAAFAMIAASGDIYFGLWYPVTVAAVTLVIGLLFLKDRRSVDIAA